MKKQETIDVIPSKKIVVGDKNAPVTIVEFGDYESEDCAQAHEVVARLLDLYAGQVKFIFRHFPQLKIHQKAHKAAEAAIGAAQEGKFWEMHNLLFANRRNLGVISLKQYAREAGVTNKKYLDELINGTYGLYVQDDLKDGIQLGISKVPAFFIDGVKFTQTPNFKNLNAYIKELLAKKSVDSKAAA
ncbi:MAG: thioredoxin domain-containing protein [Williamsia sp.]|nr:thioredoxin domain-containing protein [Williamsia sp.]